MADRSTPHAYVIGMFSCVFDLLFDGPGNPAYLGASKRIQDDFYEHSAVGSLLVFRRWFWGLSDAGIVTVLYLKGNRPLLMSVVGINFPNEAPKVSCEEAEKLALHNAVIRSSDLDL